VTVNQGLKLVLLWVADEYRERGHQSPQGTGRKRAI
jgi:hypothetical protein